MIGLSLANEGLRCCNPATEPAAACKACHDAIYDHYRLGLLELLGNISATGALAVINSCYPNTDYTEEEYGHVKSREPLFLPRICSRTRMGCFVLPYKSPSRGDYQ